VALFANKTLAGGDEKVTDGLKLNKERLTVLCCANSADTHRVKLLVIGKYQCPQAFKNVQHLPVVYTGQLNSWMDREIFKH
jgi:hypothetical protein